VTARCVYCNAPLDGQPWLLLNRYGIGTGSARCLSEICDEDDEYIWALNADPDKEVVTGIGLCWPECAYSFIEGRMIETDFDCRRAER